MWILSDSKVQLIIKELTIGYIEHKGTYVFSTESTQISDNFIQRGKISIYELL
jgi:hypothetical protein